MDMQKSKVMQTQEYTPSKSLTSGFEWVSAALAAIVFVALFFSLAFRIVTVSGDSMRNTLQNGDRLLLSGMFYTPNYGDIVVVRRTGDTPLIKRVIGLEGDRIRIDEESGVVYCNDQPLTEPYILGDATPAYGLKEEITVPEGTLFVMGDNRSESLDSRMLGPVSEDDLVGKVFFRIMPSFGKIGE